MSNPNFKTIGSAVFVLAALLVAACQPAPEPDPAHERAKARWDHLIAGEYAKAWEYFTPGYRETYTADQYTASIQRRPVQWEEAELVSSECEESRCQVTIDITYSIPRATAGLERVRPTRPVRETWIFSEGEWWFTPEN